MQQMNHTRESEVRPLGSSGEVFDRCLVCAQPRIKGFIRKLTEANCDLDDLVQDVNLVILLKRKDFLPGSNFIAWALQIAKFRVLNWRRSVKNLAENTCSMQELGSSIALTESHQPELVPFDDSLAFGLVGLNSEQADLLFSIYCDGYTYEDMAKKMKSNPAALRQQVARLRKMIRCRLDRVKK
jgi:RNA polymerase sigma-70 factor (ECF subfamily)